MESRPVALKIVDAPAGRVLALVDKESGLMLGGQTSLRWENGVGEPDTVTVTFVVGPAGRVSPLPDDEIEDLAARGLVDGI